MVESSEGNNCPTLRVSMMLRVTGIIFTLKSVIDEASFSDREFMTNFKLQIEVVSLKSFMKQMGNIHFTFATCVTSLWASTLMHVPLLGKALRNPAELKHIMM